MQLFFYALGLFVALEIVLYLIKQFRRPKNFPPGPNYYFPFIGNTKLLRKLAKQCGGQYEAFAELSRRYNSSLISLKLGNEFVVVVMTYALIKEIYARSEFDGRPDTYFLRLRNMGSRLGITCTDGSLWHEQRSFVVRHLRSAGYGRSKMQICIQNELDELLKFITCEREMWGGESNFFATSVINILWTFTCGSQFERDDKRLKHMFNLLNRRAKAFDMSGGSLSQMPWIRFIAPEKSGFNLINDLNKEFYKLFVEVIEEHERDFCDEKSSDDLIYAFLKEMKDRENVRDSTFIKKQLIIVILDIFIAGATTTSTLIDLTLMAMLLYPEVQRKCRDELSELNINYANRHLAPYTVATLLEVQRFFLITPITGPRRVLSDCKLDGFNIPKGTTILIGHRSMFQDREFWKDPECFRPERFLDDENNLITYLQERVLTFGSGRRRCIGDQLAKECIFTFVVGILKNFTLNKSKEAEPSTKLLPGIIFTPQKFKILFEKLKSDL